MNLDMAVKDIGIHPIKIVHAFLPLGTDLVQKRGRSVFAPTFTFMTWISAKRIWT